MLCSSFKKFCWGSTWEAPVTKSFLIKENSLIAQCSLQNILEQLQAKKFQNLFFDQKQTWSPMHHQITKTYSHSTVLLLYLLLPYYYIYYIVIFNNIHTVGSCSPLKSFSKYDSTFLLSLYQMSPPCGPYISCSLDTFESLGLFLFEISSHSLPLLDGYSNIFSTWDLKS